MPSLLNLAGGSGNLLLAGNQGNLLLVGYPLHEEYNLFELDRVEAAFKSIVRDAVSSVASPVQVFMRREEDCAHTPRVVLRLLTKQVQGQRYLLNPSFPDNRMQPRNTWMFELQAQIITNRQENPHFHLPLIGKTRLCLQFYKLAPVWTTALSPLHSIIDINEAPIELSVDSEGDLDSTTMNFAGMLFIRNEAWIR